MIELKKREFNSVLTPDYLDEIQLVSEKHKLLLTDLIQAPSLKSSLNQIEKRPGLLNGSLSSYDLEKQMKESLPKKKEKLD